MSLDPLTVGGGRKTLEVILRLGLALREDEERRRKPILGTGSGERLQKTLRE